MTTEIITPESTEAWRALRAEDITSTEVAALFDCSPYATAFELFHRKRNKEIVDIEESERMKWGNRLQDAIAQGIAQDQGWMVRRMSEYIRDTAMHLGASFDYSIETNPLGILETKNVDALQYRDGWIVDGETIEAPPHIELQLQTQLAVSGRDYGYIGALVGGNRIVLIRRDANAQVIESIKIKVAEFWKRIADENPPLPDFSRDMDIIRRIYSNVEPGKVVDVRESADMLQLAMRYRELGAAIKDIEAQRNECKAKMLTMIGDAAKAQGEMFTISAGTIGECVVKEHVREARRDFRINWKKMKEQT